MRAQQAKAREWVCDHCGNTVPPNYAHKCLEYERAGRDRTSGDIVYLWPPQNLLQIAERIEARATEDAAFAGGGVLGFRHDCHIRDIEAAFNVALHLRRIAASAGEAGTATTAKQGVVHEHAVGAAETPNTQAKGRPLNG